MADEVGKMDSLTAVFMFLTSNVLMSLTLNNKGKAFGMGVVTWLVIRT